MNFATGPVAQSPGAARTERILLWEDFAMPSGLGIWTSWIPQNVIYQPFWFIHLLVIERKRPVHTGSQDIAESISLPYGLGYGMFFGLALFNLAKSGISFITHLYVVLNQAMV